MSHKIENQLELTRANARGARAGGAFAFSYYYFYFSRVGRLPHAGWEEKP
jgi:hypothetical protein